jgi:hypothetical protein
MTVAILVLAVLYDLSLGSGLLALSVSLCDRYRTVGFAGAYDLPSAIATARLVFAGAFDLPSAIATAGLAWDYIFYFH